MCMTNMKINISKVYILMEYLIKRNKTFVLKFLFNDPKLSPLRSSFLFFPHLWSLM